MSSWHESAFESTICNFYNNVVGYLVKPSDIFVILVSYMLRFFCLSIWSMRQTRPIQPLQNISHWKSLLPMQNQKCDSIHIAMIKVKHTHQCEQKTRTVVWNIIIIVDTTSKLKKMSVARMNASRCAKKWNAANITHVRRCCAQLCHL